MVRGVQRNNYLVSQEAERDARPNLAFITNPFIRIPCYGKSPGTSESPTRPTTS